MPFYMKMNFQEYSNFNMMNMMFFHDTLNLLMLMILIKVMLNLIFLLKNSILLNMKFSLESNSLEMFWTILPSILIFFISLPSISSLYLNEEFKKSNLDYQAIGNQWYWSYQYPNLNKFSSYPYPWKLNRNLSVDNSLMMPTKTNIRFIISSNDVIHSWTLPSLMTKMDAVPGRLNTLTLFSSKSMKLKGQCSEICGVNHSFMPISVMFLKLSSNLK